MCWCTPSIRTPWCGKPACARPPAAPSAVDAPSVEVGDWLRQHRDPVSRWHGGQGPLELLLRVVTAHRHGDAGAEIDRAAVELRRQGFLGGAA